MKDEKFCFKKSTGFIALVGILLVGFVLFAQMSNTPTTLESKAGPKPKECYYAEQPLTTSSTPYRYNSSTYCIESVDASGTGTNVGYKCNQLSGTLTGGSVKDTATCPLPSASPKCQYAEVVLSTSTTPYKYDASTFCIQDASGANVGYKCNNASSALTGGSVKDLTTCPVRVSPPRTACSFGGQAMSTTAVTIGKYDYMLDANGCVLENGRKLGLKCDSTSFRVIPDRSVCGPVGRTACKYGGETLPATIGTQAYGVDGSGCVLANGSTIGYKCDSSTGFMAKKDASCAAPASAKKCQYAEVNLTTSSTPYRYDSTTYCIESTSDVNVGYKCNNDGSTLTGGSMKDTVTCPMPTPAPRTSCSWGGVAIGTTPVQIGTKYYAMDGACITEGANSTTLYNNGFKCDASTGYTSVKDTTTCSL